MNRILLTATLCFSAIQLFFAQSEAKAPTEKTATENLFIVTLDGFRWQEVFGGADSALLFNREYIHDSTYYVQKFWAGSPSSRRQTLLPFFWTTIARQGQIYGNRHLENKVNVSNGMWFSYPGYNEIFTGNPDDKNIYSNDKIPNPNTNVLEFLNRQKGFEGKIAAFSSWDVFPWILNEKRSGILVNSAIEDIEGVSSPTARLLNQLQHQQPMLWEEGVRLDFLTWAIMREYVASNHPRVVYVGLDETDDDAHEGRYDLYLSVAHQADSWLSELWQFIENDPQYRGKTTLFITCDHGRGDKVKKQWRDHGAKVEDSSEIWFAVLGPDSKPTGEVRQPGQYYQKQFAQTFAHLLGQHFICEHEVGQAIESVLNR